MSLRVVIAIALLCFAALATAQDLQPVPALTAHVVDTTNTLDPIQQKGLEDKLIAFEQAKGTQIAILMVATTRPEDDASYANRVANTWKIGRRGVGDGILVVLAKDDHKVRIEVAKTLEGAVPDLAAKHIIDDAMIPKFRTGDFAGGLQAGVDQLIARINGEPLPAPAARPDHARTAAGGFDWTDLALFFFIGVPVAGAVLRGLFGRGFGSLVTGIGAGALALVVTSSLAVAIVAAIIALVWTLVPGSLGLMRGGPWVAGGPWIGGGGGGGGRGGGGGWSSGGGGDFGGGGASGNW